jgi:hypothetical protein
MSSPTPLRRSARLAAKGTGAPIALAPAPSPWKVWSAFCDRVRKLIYPIYKTSYTEILSFAGLLKERKGLHEWTDEAILAELVQWLETRCIVSWNQPIYNALIWKVNDPATQDKSGYYHAAKFVRDLTVSLFAEDNYTIERLLGHVANEDVISEEAAEFIDAFIDAFVSARNHRGY